MYEEKDCKIIQDLLPNYIENLTSAETNSYIEGHLKDCSKCRNILENMKKDLELNSKKRDEREVKYFKKFNNKMRVLKIIIILIIFIFLVLTGRKFFIISQLSDKAENTIVSNNYHKITYSYNMGDYTKLEVFCLDNKIKLITTRHYR